MRRRSSMGLSLWKGKGSSQAIRKESAASAKVDEEDSRNGKDVDVKAEQASSKDKRPLARQIEKRKQATDRLYAAVESYWSAIGKKKPLPFDLDKNGALAATMTLDNAASSIREVYNDKSEIVERSARNGGQVLARSKDKLLPVEALGLAMAASANSYASMEMGNAQSEGDLHLKKDTRYASHLAYLAAVHLALGELQTAFSESLAETVLSRLARLQAGIGALHSVEKKSETARQSMEAAERKRDKARLKGESKREIEEEARAATAVYEEASADLENRIAIFTQMEKKGYGSGELLLKDYLDLHITHVQGQLEVLTHARKALDEAKIDTSKDDVIEDSEIAGYNSSRPPVSRQARPPIKRRGQSSSTVASNLQSQAASTMAAASASVSSLQREGLSKRVSKVMPFRNKSSTTSACATENGDADKALSSTQSQVSSAQSGGFSEADNGIDRNRKDSASGKLGQKLGSALARSEKDGRNRGNTVTLEDKALSSSSSSPSMANLRLARAAARLTPFKDSSKAYRDMDYCPDPSDMAHDSLIEPGQREDHVYRTTYDGVDTLVTEHNAEHTLSTSDDHLTPTLLSRRNDAMKSAKRRSDVHYAERSVVGDGPVGFLNVSSLTPHWTGTSTASSDDDDPFGDHHK